MRLTEDYKASNFRSTSQFSSFAEHGFRRKTAVSTVVLFCHIPVFQCFRFPELFQLHCKLICRTPRFVLAACKAGFIYNVGKFLMVCTGFHVWHIAVFSLFSNHVIDAHSISFFCHFFVDLFGIISSDRSQRLPAIWGFVMFQDVIRCFLYIFCRAQEFECFRKLLFQLRNCVFQLHISVSDRNAFFPC